MMTKKEQAFADELEKYENQWVAIVRSADDEKVVANGTRLKETRREAEAQGFRDVVFMKVPSSHKVFVGFTLG